MTIPAPNLDDRSFEDLLQELQLLIPTYTPELALGRQDWTDWNESDPGTTLLQLWAHIAETILNRVNRVPDRAYVKFLELVGLRLRPARPAVADVTFTPQAGFVPQGGATGITVPVRTELSAQPAGGGDPLTFETTRPLDLVRSTLARVLVLDAGAASNVTDQNGPDGPEFRPLGWVPQPNNALYLGFEPPDPPIIGRVFPEAVRLRFFAPQEVGGSTSCRDIDGLRPTVTLAWEFRRGPDDPRWRELEVYEDTTSGLQRGGYVTIAGPEEIDPVTGVGAVAEPMLWLRCRLVTGAYPAGRSPRVAFVRPNTVAAENLATVRHEIIGTSEGHPDQSFRARKVPLQPESIELEVEEGDEFVPWSRQDDLLASTAEDRHYAVDAASGTVTFGDGRRGRIPPAGTRIILRSYRAGASAAGNVGPALITTVLSGVPGVEGVTNERAAVGGADVQSVDELRRDAPARLRSLNRAVTAEDYEKLALQVGTVARARALHLTHPDHRGVEVPGSVTVVIVPDSDDPAPSPSPQLCEEVCRHLEPKRTVSTELHVVAPRYRLIKVVAVVEAEPNAGFDTVKLLAKGAINAALDPLGRPAPPLPGEPPTVERGDPDQGYEFGSDFAPSTLYGVLLGVDDVVAVRSLSIDLNGSPVDSITKAIVLERDELLYGADDHEITVVPKVDRSVRLV